MRQAKPWRCAILGALLATALSSFASAKDDEPLELVEIKDRPGKELTSAILGRGGELGMFHDVDADGDLEFVALNRDKHFLELDVRQLDTDALSLQVDIGDGAAAGLVAVNLDADAPLEFIVAYGERLEGAKKGLVMFAASLGRIFVGLAQFQAGSSVALLPVLRPGTDVDLKVLLAVDDDGTILWQRDLRDAAVEGDGWNRTRFQWALPGADGTGATILISDDGHDALSGISAADGSTLWSETVPGDTRASQRAFAALIDEGRQFPVFGAEGDLFIVDPQTGRSVLEVEGKLGLNALASSQVFGRGDGKRVLLYGNDDHTELRMIALATGETVWSDQVEEVLQILPLSDGDRFMAIEESAIRIYGADGALEANVPAPDKIKTKYPPIYRDLNGDGEPELLFVSGKTIFCWYPATNTTKWTASLGGMVGGANPIEIYDAFYDIDGDGWLDVPGKKGSGEGQWLSGATGEVLTSAGNGSIMPIIGDWNDDGRPEVFWVKTWYEVRNASD